MITQGEYFAARSALAALFQQRREILTQGFEALRRWLASGVSPRWRALEAVLHQAEAETRLRPCGAATSGGGTDSGGDPAAAAQDEAYSGKMPAR